MEKKYHCKYTMDLEHGEFTKEDASSANIGLTDALVLVSVLRGGEKAHDGDTSHKTISYDGQNKGQPIPDTELFSVWSGLAFQLMGKESDCSDWQKEIANETFEKVRMQIMNSRFFNE
jgi:hypothetical protein